MLTQKGQKKQKWSSWELNPGFPREAIMRTRRVKNRFLKIFFLGCQSLNVTAFEREIEKFARIEIKYINRRGYNEVKER